MLACFVPVLYSVVLRLFVYIRCVCVVFFCSVLDCMALSFHVFHCSVGLICLCCSACVVPRQESMDANVFTLYIVRLFY